MALFSQLLTLAVSMMVFYHILDWIISWTAFHSWLESRISYPYNITSTSGSAGYSRNGRSTHNSTSWPIKYICIWFAFVATLQSVTTIVENSNQPGLVSNSDCQFDHKPDAWSQRQTWVQCEHDHDSSNHAPEFEAGLKNGQTSLVRLRRCLLLSVFTNISQVLCFLVDAPIFQISGYQLRKYIK